MTATEEQFVDLSIYIEVLKKRAKMIGIISILGLLVGSIIAYKLPYQTMALVRIGNVAKDLAIPPDEITYLLFNDKVSRRNRTLYNIEPISNQPYIQFTFRGQDKFNLVYEAKNIIGSFIDQGKPKYYKLVQYYEKKIEELNKQITILQKQNTNIDFLVQEIIRSKTGLSPEEISKNIALNSIILNNQTLLDGLIQKKGELEWKLEQRSDFSIVISPKIPDPPARPSRTLLVSGSVIISLFMGYFLALLSELYKKSKDRMTA